MATDTESTREAFGLDLSGFTKRSGLAFARRNGSSIELHLIKDHPLEVEFAGKEETWREREVAFVECLVRRAALYVDVPIDLQELLSPDQVVTAWWQLTMRPVDKILKGLAPTGVADERQRLERDRLSNLLTKLADQQNLKPRTVTVPKGYVLLGETPLGEKIVYDHSSYKDFLECILSTCGQDS